MEQGTKKQTAAELRKAECERITAELEQQGYVRKNATISILKANLMMLVTSLPVCILLGLLYALVNVVRRETAFSDFSGIVFWLAMLISIPVHEFLHGLGWVSSCKNGWKSIRFGVMWSSLTPYCNCKEPMDVKSYFRGLLMPFAVLGLLPSIIAIAVGNVILLAIGLVHFNEVWRIIVSIIAKLSRIPNNLFFIDRFSLLYLRLLYPPQISCLFINKH